MLKEKPRGYFSQGFYKKKVGVKICVIFGFIKGAIQMRIKKGKNEKRSNWLRRFELRCFICR